jgi:hypothetical protein
VSGDVQAVADRRGWLSRLVAVEEFVVRLDVIGQVPQVQNPPVSQSECARECLLHTIRFDPLLDI